MKTILFATLASLCLSFLCNAQVNPSKTHSLEDYRRFVVALATRVAEAHKEGDEQVSDAEGATIEQIRMALAPSAGPA